MRDQATELRNLVLRCARDHARDTGPPPRLFVVSGGQSGVGVTTLAVNLAVAAAEQGSRVVLVDADLRQPRIADLCGLQPQGFVTDIAAARKDIHEVLVRGPAGTQIAAGRPRGTPAPQWNESELEKAQTRLITQLRTLGRHADLIVLDAGSGTDSAVGRFWQAADEVLLTTTPEPLAVMDAYATIKTVVAHGDHPALNLVVNRVNDPALGGDVHRRIDQSCRRFLGQGVDWAGQIPDDPALHATNDQTVPLLAQQPQCPAAQAIGKLVDWLEAARRKAA